MSRPPQPLSKDLAQSLNIALAPSDADVCRMTREILDDRNLTASALSAMLGINGQLMLDLQKDLPTKISPVLRRLVWFIWTFDRNPEVLVSPLLIASWGRSETPDTARKRTKAEESCLWFQANVPAQLRPGSVYLTFDWNNTNAQLACHSGYSERVIQHSRTVISEWTKTHLNRWRRIVGLLKINEEKFKPFFEWLRIQNEQTAEKQRIAKNRQKRAYDAQKKRQLEQEQRRAMEKPYVQNLNGSVTREQRLAQMRAYSTVWNAKQRAKKKSDTGDTFPLTATPERCEAAPVAENNNPSTTHESQTEPSPPVVPSPVHPEIGERL